MEPGTLCQIPQGVDARPRTTAASRGVIPVAASGRRQASGPPQARQCPGKATPGLS
jgi:hypothetical protein